MQTLAEEYCDLALEEAEKHNESRSVLEKIMWLNKQSAIDILYDEAIEGNKIYDNILIYLVNESNKLSFKKDKEYYLTETKKIRKLYSQKLVSDSENEIKQNNILLNSAHKEVKKLNSEEKTFVNGHKLETALSDISKYEDFLSSRDRFETSIFDDNHYRYVVRYSERCLTLLENLLRQEIIQVEEKGIKVLEDEGYNYSNDMRNQKRYKLKKQIFYCLEQYFLVTKSELSGDSIVKITNGSIESEEYGDRILEWDKEVTSNEKMKLFK